MEIADSLAVSGNVRGLVKGADASHQPGYDPGWLQHHQSYNRVVVEEISTEVKQLTNKLSKNKTNPEWLYTVLALQHLVTWLHADVVDM